MINNFMMKNQKIFSYNRHDSLSRSEALFHFSTFRHNQWTEK